MMNVSPSPSPRRMPPRPRSLTSGGAFSSPLGPQHSIHAADEADHDQGYGYGSGYGGDDDRNGFYQISLSNGPASQSPPADDPLSSSHLQSQQHRQLQQHRPHSYYEPNSYSSNYNYHHNGSSGSGSSNYSSARNDPGSLRPVQEYHNAFANVDAASTAAVSPGSASASPFVSFSSASRAFLDHRRQQSIPNLLPSIASSLGKNISRAISPDRSLRSPRVPVPADRRKQQQDSDEGDEDSASDSDSEEEADSRDMAPFTGDARTRRTNTYTTYKGSRNNSSNARNSNDNPSVAAGFTNWLSGGSGGTKAASPDSSSYTSSSRAATPESVILAHRGGGAVAGGPGSGTYRNLSLASDSSATLRNSVPAPSTTSPSRFSQFASSMSATLSRLTQQQQSPGSPRGAASSAAGFENDEFYYLDVDAALFPAGQPSERDAFSPSAYKNLEANATGVLKRLQTAYKQRSLALRDLAAEKSARDEELEEAETRAQHLKMQLEGMARKAAEQQKEMQTLMDELAAERKARAQERAMLLSGVPTTPTASQMDAGGRPLSAMRDRDDDQATTTVLSEDLGVEEAQRAQKRRNAWRRRSLKSADGSSYDGTDDGNEEEVRSADEDESNSSVFSRSRSPTIAPSINFSYSNHDGANSDIQHSQVSHPRVAALGSSTRQGSRLVSSSSTATTISQPPMSTFQKLMKNVTAALKDEEPEFLGNGVSNCRNCRGQDVSFAWNTVSILRDENKHLKQRVGQLEVAVEGVLDMVNGVGLD